MDGKHASLFGLQSVIPRSLEIALTARRKPGFVIFTNFLPKIGRRLAENSVFGNRGYP